jgi:hypothetical protein
LASAAGAGTLGASPTPACDGNVAWDGRRRRLFTGATGRIVPTPALGQDSRPPPRRPLSRFSRPTNQ